MAPGGGAHSVRAPPPRSFARHLQACGRQWQSRGVMLAAGGLADRGQPPHTTMRWQPPPSANPYQAPRGVGGGVSAPPLPPLLGAAAVAGQDRSLPPRPKTSPQLRLGGLAPCPHHSRAGGVERGWGRGRAGQTDWEGRTARGRYAGWPRIWNGRPLKLPTTLLVIITYHNVLHSETPRRLSNLGC